MYNYDVTTTTSTANWWDISQMTAAAVAIFVVIALITLALVIFLIVAECKLFTKAGEAWWKAIIPMYNSWVQTKITGLAWWWFPIYIGFAGLTGFKSFEFAAGMGIILISFNYNYNLAKKFGKSNGFAFLTTILPIIGLPILAFGSAKYDKNAATDKNGIFAVEKGLVK